MHRSIRLKIGIILIVFFALFSSSAIIKESLKIKKISVDHDKVSLYEKRFEDLKKILSDAKIVGYIGNESPDSDRYYFMTQYSLAPVIVDPYRNHPLVIGNFSKPKFDHDILKKNNYHISADFNNGVILVSRQKSAGDAGSPAIYKLSKTFSQVEIIKTSDGKSIHIVPDALRGHLEQIIVKNKSVLVSGWAADVKKSEAARAILIFVNGKFYYSGILNSKRQDVVEVFGNKALLKSGFEYTFSVSLKDKKISEVRFFALSEDGNASELIYPKDYRWSRKS